MLQQLAQNLCGLYKTYGYQQYSMSKFEEYDLYLQNKDFLISDRILTFTDTDGRLMALKPDVTLSIIKNTQTQQQMLQKDLLPGECVPSRKIRSGLSGDYADWPGVYGSGGYLQHL